MKNKKHRMKKKGKKKRVKVSLKKEKNVMKV